MKDLWPNLSKDQTIRYMLLEESDTKAYDEEEVKEISDEILIRQKTVKELFPFTKAKETSFFRCPTWIISLLY